MAFTPATAAALLQESEIGYNLTLEGRINFTGADEWEEIPYVRGSLVVRKTRGRNSELSFRILDSDFSMRLERSQTNRGQLFADARVRADLGSESDYIFRGRLEQVHPKDHALPSAGRCWRSRIEESQCDVSLTPTEVEVVADGSYRQLYELDQEPGLYVLQTTGGGDEGFDEATSTIRRPWAPGNTRIFRDDGGGGKEELGSELYQAYWTSGSVAINEATSGETYYVSNLRCCKESAAASAENVDWSQAVIQALQHGWDESGGEYDASTLGMGLTDAEISIGACGLDCPGPYSFTGTVEDLILDLRDRVADNLDLDYDSRLDVFTWGFTQQQTSGNEDGTLYHARSISQPRNIKQIVTGVIARGVETQPTNRLAVVHSTSPSNPTNLNTGANLIKWDGQDTLDGQNWDDITEFLTDGDSQYGAGCMSLAASEGGGSDFYDSWYDFCKWDLDEILRARGLYIVAGQSWHHRHQAYGQYGDCWLWPGYQLLGSTDDVNYFPVAPALDKVRVKPATRVDVGEEGITRPRLQYLKLVCGAYKHGNYNQSDPSIGLLEIALIADTEYEHKLTIYPWEHAIIAVDISAETLTIAGDHRETFAEGEWLEVYGSTGNDGYWQVDSVQYSGGNTIITVTGNLTDATVDGTISPVYAYSDHTASNPHAWRRAHPDLYTRVVSTFAAHSITAVDISAETLTIAGDLDEVYAAGERILVAGSTGNDGVWTIASSTYSGGNTIITVTGNLTDATVDGTLRILGGHGQHRSVELDFSSEFTASRGRDAGIQHLAESVRLFEDVSYEAICDPRFDPGQTVIVVDSLNGNVDSIMLESVEFRENGAKFYGTNYLAAGVSNA